MENKKAALVLAQSMVSPVRSAHSVSPGAFGPLEFPFDMLGAQMLTLHWKCMKPKKGRFARKTKTTRNN